MESNTTSMPCLLVQDVFKKAAYLSTGSVDSRPTFQRDAVDDDCTGTGTSGLNIINWKEMSLGKGALVGAAYGSMVMPEFKGGRKANLQKKLPNLAQDVCNLAPPSYLLSPFPCWLLQRMSKPVCNAFGFPCSSEQIYPLLPTQTVYQSIEPRPLRAFRM